LFIDKWVKVKQFFHTQKIKKQKYRTQIKNLITGVNDFNDLVKFALTKLVFAQSAERRCYVGRFLGSSGKFKNAPKTKFLTNCKRSNH